MKDQKTAIVTLTADIVLVRQNEQGDDELLLIKRLHEPYAGMYALPGGKMNEDETIYQTAKRELKEETGISLDCLEQVSLFSAPERDPRGRFVSVVFFSLSYQKNIVVQAGDDAAEARWFPLSDLPLLAFDHFQIINHVILEQNEYRSCMRDYVESKLSLWRYMVNALRTERIWPSNQGYCPQS